MGAYCGGTSWCRTSVLQLFRLALRPHKLSSRMATPTGLEPVTSSVTGWRSALLNYGAKWCSRPELNLRPHDYQSCALPSELREHLATGVRLELTHPFGLAGFLDRWTAIALPCHMAKRGRLELPHPRLGGVKQISNLLPYHWASPLRMITKSIVLQTHLILLLWT